MHAPRTIRALLVASVAVCAIASPLANVGVTSAAAQAVSLSVEFRTALEPYGSWRHHRRWGDVWAPSRVGPDWKPYTVGHWVYSQDYGWYWAAADQEAEWGLVAYHYGRWVNDEELGWVWIPGNEWGPGWVLWRHGNEYAGWAPLPPDELAVEYREAPQAWVFVRERDIVAPRMTEVILPQREREVVFRDTVVVNRTVILQDRRFAVNPGIPPTYIAAAYGRPIPSYEVSPRVLAGSANLPRATVVQADDFRNREHMQQVARESTFVRQAATTVAPARNLPPLQPLAANERGRLGALPPRAAQAGAGQDRPEGPIAPGTAGNERPGREPPGRPVPSRQGAAPGQAPGQSPGQPLQRQGREGRPGTQEPGRGAELNRPGSVQDSSRDRDQRDRRSLREGQPATPHAPVTSGQGERRPQAGASEPRTNGAAPGRESGGERRLRDRPSDRTAAPQEPRNRERPGVESQSSRSHAPGDERGATRRPASAEQPRLPSAAQRGPSPGVDAPRAHAPAAERPRPQSPSTTGAAPGGGRGAPEGGGRHEERR
jgi:hypothetical protein